MTGSLCKLPDQDNVDAVNHDRSPSSLASHKYLLEVRR